MSKDINAIAAAGYIYQDRQGLRILCDWLDAPARYARVKFSATMWPRRRRGLGDIIAERGGMAKP